MTTREEHYARKRAEKYGEPLPPPKPETPAIERYLQSIEKSNRQIATNTGIMAFLVLLSALLGFCV